MAKTIEELQAENKALQTKLAETMAVLGTDYSPCEGCGRPTYMELLAKVKVYETRNPNLTASLPPSAPKKLKWAAETAFTTNATGSVICKQTVSDLSSGKKVDISALDKRVNMSEYVNSDGAASKDNLEGLLAFLKEKEVLLDENGRKIIADKPA